MLQTSFDFTGEQLRDAGIRLSKEHQDKISEGWSERAYDLLCGQFLDNYGHDVFSSEDLRAYAAEVNFELPNESRAWAAVFVKARKENVIQSAGMGFSKNPQAHKRPINLWRKA